MADAAFSRSADHPDVRDQRQVLRLHAVVGRDCTLQPADRRAHTLPMELPALTTTVTTPRIYALGTATTGLSFAVIALSAHRYHDDPRPSVAARLGRRSGVTR